MLTRKISSPLSFIYFVRTHFSRGKLASIKSYCFDSYKLDYDCNYSMKLVKLVKQLKGDFLALAR